MGRNEVYLSQGHICRRDILIFVTLGSQKFQFNRLLIEIDRLVEDNIITEKVFAQIGYSDYQPKNYEYKKFLDRDEFKGLMDKCDKVITHGGTGAIVGAVKGRKKVIAVPRLSQYGEHVDDHQLQIVEQFREMNLIISVNEIDEIEKSLQILSDTEFKTYESNTQNIIDEIEQFIHSR